MYVSGLSLLSVLVYVQKLYNSTKYDVYIIKDQNHSLYKAVIIYILLSSYESVLNTLYHTVLFVE